MSDSEALIEARLATVDFRIDRLANAVQHARAKDRGPAGIEGTQGPQGEPGPQGDTGPMPVHEWVGTSLRFRQGPDGSTWGALVELKGDAGEVRVVPGGGGGGSVGYFALNVGGIVAGPTAIVGATLHDDGTWRKPWAYFPIGF